MGAGVKSAEFGCIWKTMFISAMCYPSNIRTKDDILKRRRYKTFYNSLKYVIPCKYCREYTRDVLEKKFPLDFRGRLSLMYSIYIWKDQINKKLINQGCKKTKISPPFKEVLNKYKQLSAKCDKKIGKCV